MFSPLDITIKPSRYFRVIFAGCSIVACCAALYSSTSLVLLLFVGALLLALAFMPADSTEVMRLVWDLDRHSIRLWCLDGNWQDGLTIEKIHLLPYLFFFRVITKSGKRISIAVFPDSVSDEEFRRLKVALRLGKMTLGSKAIRS